MSKKTRRNQAPVGQDIPEAIMHGVSLIETELAKRGSMSIALPPRSYRMADKFEDNGHLFEVGMVGNARPALTEARFRQFVAFATAIASTDKVQSHRFDRKSASFKPVTIQTHPHNVDGHLLYIPAGAARQITPKGIFEPPGFTTGTTILGPGDAAVSFVVSSASVRPADRTMTAATEIMQNRCIVNGFSLENGKSYDQMPQSYVYQETLANAAGNMLGAVALGWSYRTYQDFMSNNFDPTTLYSTTIKNSFGRGDTEVIAPHLMFSADTYSLIADGEVPTEVPELIPRRPLGT